MRQPHVPASIPRTARRRLRPAHALPGPARRGAALGALALVLVACSSNPGWPEAPPPDEGLDLATLADTDLRRVYGSSGDGSLGLPVAGGSDVDGDGRLDTAFGAMQASPAGVSRAGLVFVVFGDGTVTGAIDTAEPSPNVLRIQGSQPYEYAGSELWLDDVTGDGIGDVLIARQNHSPALGTSQERRAAGALSIVVGGAALRAQSSSLEALALDDPTNGVEVLTLLGAAAQSRLGIWLRTGDVTGDGVADLVVGADQEDAGAEAAGAAYVIAGGPHLGAAGRVDLGASDGSVLTGNVARLTPPLTPAPVAYHFGATCQLADLDGNGRAEVLVAATLNRAGAILDVDGGFSAAGGGGPPGGRLYVAWDDNFPALPWPEAFGFAIGAGGGAHTILSGSAGNDSFGEELLGGLDWDADGSAELFVGDLTANPLGRPGAGASYVIYDAQRLRGLETSLAELETLEPPIRTTAIFGAAVGDISGDTAAQGDFSGDGVADLVVCSPHGNPLRRASAGTLHVLYGRVGGFPTRVDLREPPPAAELDMLAVFGAHGTFGTDTGDTLCYSAATGDLDGDGRTDLIANEMVGNGLTPEAIDVGNMLLLGAPLGGPLPR